jgi:hypothetical protein
MGKMMGTQFMAAVTFGIQVKISENYNGTDLHLNSFIAWNVILVWSESKYKTSLRQSSNFGTPSHLLFLPDSNFLALAFIHPTRDVGDNLAAMYCNEL